jgi:energy-coupling factor transporter ATP-binding protein EcfA2
MSAGREAELMELVDFVRGQAESAIVMIEHSMNDLTDEVVHYEAGGTSNTIAQLLAHLVTGQDLLIQDKIRGGGTTLHDSGWAEKTGVPADRTLIWQRAAWRMNLPGFEEYVRAVLANSRAYLASLTPAVLDEKHAWVRGPEQPVYRLMQTIFINHALGHCGEISTLKGIQGLKGLPI